MINLNKISNKPSLGAWLPNVKLLSSKIDEIINWLNGTKGKGSCKVYTVLVSQSGTSKPTDKILNNTLGNISYIRSAVGTYFVKSDGLFTENKTFLHIEYDADPLFTKPTTIIYQDSSTLVLYTYDNTGTATDDVLFNTSMEIRVYN